MTIIKLSFLVLGSLVTDRLVTCLSSSYATPFNASKTALATLSISGLDVSNSAKRRLGQLLGNSL